MDTLVVIMLLVSSLIPRLGHRSYRVREAAQQSLGEMGEVAWPALALAHSHPDLEIKRRAQLLRPGWVEEVAEAKSRRFMKKLPWIDGEVLHATTKFYYLKLARPNVKKQGSPNWNEYREATRLWIKSQILQKRPRREILETLSLLITAEKKWTLANQPPTPGGK